MPQSHNQQLQQQHLTREQQTLGKKVKQTAPAPNQTLNTITMSAAAAAAAPTLTTTSGVIVPIQRAGCVTTRRERRGCKAGVIVGAAVVAAGAAYLVEKHRCHHRDCDMDYYY